MFGFFSPCSLNHWDSVFVIFWPCFYSKKYLINPHIDTCLERIENEICKNKIYKHGKKQQQWLYDCFDHCLDALVKFPYSIWPHYIFIKLWISIIFLEAYKTPTALNGKRNMTISKMAIVHNIFKCISNENSLDRSYLSR